MKADQGRHFDSIITSQVGPLLACLKKAKEVEPVGLLGCLRQEAKYAFEFGALQ